ncbi:MAG: multicopper oxidase family protein [Rhodothermales bacterium]|nr:multicopper oxidase family protein [Rhodothermales bacterium]
MTGVVKRMWLVAVAIVVSVPAAYAQHEGHNMNMGEQAVDEWRMPPMDMSMPMLPGLHDAVPSVEAFLPGAGHNVSHFPKAVPSEVMTVADGDTVRIEAMLVRRTIEGKDFVMMGYNGQYPGPMIRSTRDARIYVDFVNNIEMPTTVHWHGIRIDNAFDGIPGITQAPVENGESFLYEIKLPDAGIYWYHPHMREDLQQDLGLYGNLLVDPPNDDYYGSVHREEVLILDDILMDDLGLIPFGATAPTNALMGRFGNVMLANGSPDYRLSTKAGEVVRFYLTNVANSRTFNVTFGNADVKVVGSDVSRYEREQWISSVPIAPAERYIVDVRFNQAGTVHIANTIQAINHFRGEFYPHVDTLVTVDVTDEPAGDLETDFDVLREHTDVQADVASFEKYFDKPVDHRLELTLKVKGLHTSIMQSMEIDTLYVPPIEWNDAMPMMNWLATGKEVTWILKDSDTGNENMNIDWNFSTGDLVKLRIFNEPRSFHPMNHPFHVHGQRFLITAIDGVRPENMVWKDTVIIPVGSTIDLLIDVTNPGDWMMHCHIAEHLHAGMMLKFSVDEGPRGSN